MSSYLPTMVVNKGDKEGAMSSIRQVYAVVSRWPSISIVKLMTPLLVLSVRTIYISTWMNLVHDMNHLSVPDAITMLTVPATATMSSTDMSETTNSSGQGMFHQIHVTPPIVLERQAMIEQASTDRNQTNGKEGDTKEWPAWKHNWYEKAMAIQSLRDEANAEEQFVHSDSSPPTRNAIRAVRPPIHLMHLQQARNKNKSTIAIISSTRSVPNQQHPAIAETALVKNLVESVRQTVTTDEQEKWNIRLYVAVDGDDLFWLEQFTLMQPPPFLEIVLAMFHKKQNHVPFTEVAHVAYKDNAEYFCRVNDDTEFVSSGWITAAVDVLQNKMIPPNLGVVGAACKEGNTKIFTHDFVHRTHLDVFDGEYYPQIFSNFYLDDWITNVYSPGVIGIDRSYLLNSWVVKHHLSPTRYQPNYLSFNWLPFEYERGWRKISRFLQKKHPSLRSVIETVATRDPKRYFPDGLDPLLVHYVRKDLPENGNLLIWEYNEEHSKFWHKITAGRVLFLKDAEDPKSVIPTPFYLDSRRITYQEKNSWWEGKVHSQPQQLLSSNQSYFFCSDAENRTDMMLKGWDLPLDVVNETLWDVILIPEHPSRDRQLQNFFMSYQIANKQTKLLVIQNDIGNSYDEVKQDLLDNLTLMKKNSGLSSEQLVAHYPEDLLLLLLWFERHPDDTLLPFQPVEIIGNLTRSRMGDHQPSPMIVRYHVHKEECLWGS